MPADDRVGLEQYEGLAPVGPEAKEGYPQEPVHGPKREPFAVDPLEDRRLNAGESGSRLEVKLESLTSMQARRAAISEGHAWLTAVAARSRNSNDFNYYEVFSRDKHLRAQ